ncbi:MAG: NmrA/HSCARG family protein [Pantoea sp.]|uniref:NmrA/HSCARG family protein n=1 Tax=Pantoea sp. TaxID=69393 RepID=UPI002389E4B6|nr:NmrA/HSCARG family protein [Pantoea sp.]MDE1186268.1 NmrA/HSCARG family protein [Pantoea sp.]
METIVDRQGKTILVFGATGQQGGAVAAALRAQGWPVTALVRDVDSAKARALATSGVALARGDLADRSSIEAAMAGVYGVFSVQPSSGQSVADGGVTDAEEIRYGSDIADIAKASGVKHLVYTSVNAAGPEKTGMGHFDSKSRIEAHIAGLDIASTIIRPSAFMEILMLPGMGLDQGMFSFAMQPDQPMQFIAVEDIGRIVAGIFADPATFTGRTIEIAGDALTGNELAGRLSQAAGRPIRYLRFPDSLLDDNLFLAGLVALVDDGRLAGNADLAALRRDFPGLLTMEQWLETTGKPLLLAAMEADGGPIALR